MAALYDHGPGHQLGQGPAPFGPQQLGDDKVWSQAQMFAMQQGIPLFTPPATSHGQAQVHPQQQAAFLMSLQRQQALLQQQQQQQQQQHERRLLLPDLRRVPASAADKQWEHE
ncbi:hypothetical protein SCP_0400040 [Sparassis crispa]|uniref:Uncharacterized protein n=1 Tax=Sparassis crispa TaxID=139825 RepID=A0A401GHN5_9APHY|nr:hypothetical protein SCP_0400040 [Sparassis crispa]GBE81633.1 hypothetical protein SCP_0400040 [Sparassis crispa]